MDFDDAFRTYPGVAGPYADDFERDSSLVLHNLRALKLRNSPGSEFVLENLTVQSLGILYYDGVPKPGTLLKFLHRSTPALTCLWFQEGFTNEIEIVALL